VAGRRIPAAFGHVGNHWRHQRLAEAARDLVGGVLHDELVFAIHHVRAFLLGARRADDHVGGAAGDEVAHLGPRQLFDEHRVWRFGRRHRRGRVSGTLRGHCHGQNWNGKNGH
jgi:hypothetical protein